MHQSEHSLEAQLPYLQKKLGTFELIPIVMGNIDPKIVADALIPYIDEHSLIVASSDLSHYHEYEKAKDIDQSCIEAIVNYNFSQISLSSCEACGKIPVITLMRIAQEKGWSAKLIDYKNSGDTAGSKDRVVGYASIAFFSEGKTNETLPLEGRVYGEYASSYEGENFDMLSDTTPPEDVTGFSATAGDHTIILSWTLSINSAGDLFTQLLYVDSGSGYGDPIYLGREKVSYEITGLTNGINYNTKLTVIDSHFNESDGVTATAIPQALPIIQTTSFPWNLPPTSILNNNRTWPNIWNNQLNSGWENFFNQTNSKLSFAENVGPNMDYSDPATKFIEGWLNSLGHKQNIEGDYNLTGIDFSKVRQFNYLNKFNEIEENYYIPDFCTLSDIYFQNGNLEEAEKYIKIALKYAPDNPQCYFIMGNILLKKDISKALYYFEKSKELGGLTWGVAHNLALCYIHT